MLQRLTRFYSCMLAWKLWQRIPNIKALEKTALDENRHYLDKFVRSATDALTCSSISSDWVSTICFLISSISSISRCRSRSSASTSISRSRRRLCNALPLQERNKTVSWCFSWVLRFLSFVNGFKIHATWYDQSERGHKTKLNFDWLQVHAIFPEDNYGYYFKFKVEN